MPRKRDGGPQSRAPLLGYALLLATRARGLSRTNVVVVIIIVVVPVRGALRVRGRNSFDELTEVGPGDDAELTDDATVCQAMLGIPDDRSRFHIFHAAQQRVAQMRDLWRENQLYIDVNHSSSSCFKLTKRENQPEAQIGKTE